MSNKNLYICFDFFDFKNVKKEKDFHNQFFNKIPKKFQDISKNKEEYNKFHNNIMSSSDNTKIFYTGIENNFKIEKFENKKEKINKYLKKIFGDKFFENINVKNLEITKTIINEKGKRLISILFYFDKSNEELNQKDNFNNEIYYNYILFPLDFSNIHNKS